ncbi:MAG: hypothetical protein AB7H77_08595 [Bdellovibrionales bacterium]
MKRRLNIYTLLVLFAAAPLLAGCGSSCECPRCPGTTVVTPPHSSSTVIAPD